MDLAVDFDCPHPNKVPTIFNRIDMHGKKGKSSFLDWIGYMIGVVVVGFILFILLWPVIDPTPDRSSSIKENLSSFSKK